MSKPKLTYFDAPVSRGDECRLALHPSDDFEAARHEGMMQHVEELRAVVSPTLRMGDAEK
jgi:hypothetical protein